MSQRSDSTTPLLCQMLEQLMVFTVIATTAIAIALASIAFQSASFASSETETMSTEASAHLEQQLATAREERDALVFETEARIAELNETLESERAEMAVLRDKLDAAKIAQEAKAEAGIAELIETLQIATANIALASLAFQADSVALSKGEEKVPEDILTDQGSAETRARLERQLAIAREERDALVFETEDRIAELTETLESERAEMDALRDELAAGKIAQETKADAEAQIAELTETLESERAEMEALRDELAAAESALAEAETTATAEHPVNNLGVSQADAEEIGGRLTEKGILIDLSSDELSFASASAIMPKTHLPTLDRVAARLNDHPQLNVRIEGHTDSLGSPEINQPLSQQRAEAVRQALIERGLSAERVTAHSAGSTQPIVDNATPEGRRQNRRVEIYLMAAQEDNAVAAIDTDE